MRKILLVVISLLSFSAMADKDTLDRCGSLADRKLKAVYQAVAFPAEYIQWGFVEKIERTKFTNTTPGSMYQEYTAAYRLIYKPAPYAYYLEQTIHAEFESPFACDDLKLKCIQLVNSKLVDGVDPTILENAGPLTCGR